MLFIKDDRQKIVSIYDEDWSIFFTKFNRKSVKKNNLVVQAGEVEKDLSFIETGIVRFWMTE